MFRKVIISNQITLIEKLILQFTSLKLSTFYKLLTVFLFLFNNIEESLKFRNFLAKLYRINLVVQQYDCIRCPLIFSNFIEF